MPQLDNPRNDVFVSEVNREKWLFQKNGLDKVDREEPSWTWKLHLLHIQEKHKKNAN